MAQPSPLAVDIETVGIEWDELHPEVQDYLLRRARDDDERQRVKDQLALHPGTGRVVAIALWRPYEDRGGVLVADPSVREPRWTPFAGVDGDAQIFRGSEREILAEFWRYVSQHAGTLVTFNGRSFDGPFLMIRSAILGVTPTRNLVPYRYSFQDHCDLAEVLSFYGVRQRNSFLFWCHQFGIASPKQAMDGSAVGAAYREGRIDDIARYCLADARATAELYRRLEPMIAVMDGRAAAGGEPGHPGPSASP
ncbi:MULTISPECIES: ribonuclease H-like domain-containing protein [Thermaerobacter]|uniref:Ribonuclease H-like domain-containing protein n=1 Tax=Thermaerobacter composti TaxID=554949 RepID=A0ABZ0QR10_9FIRM|nr:MULTISPECIES: ribonuclease H-like domain-containing protein [Thermaerobacter]PZN08597.1 MAG: 3'-5' exonuclease [Bacillota bacterium]QBS37177.1 3'-5' exonuclease [Thermaerobacter sp. FW80]WPD19187.1 ribonuclease H-like domain-containing protein [Thermaerobacter composti]